MTNGLSIQKEEFLKMSSSKRDLILFENTEELKKMIKGYRFNQKIQYSWLIILTLGFGFGKYMGVI